MFARLRNNIEYKLLALVFACALHYYVVAQKNPHLSRPLTIPLTVRNVSPNVLYDETLTPPISVTVDGPSDMLDRLSEANVTAETDMSHAHLGSNRDLRVRVHLPVSMRNDVTVTEILPQSVTVVLKERVSRHMDITATPPKTAPVGYIYRDPVVTPSSATLTGSREAVNAVQQLVVRSNADGAAGTVDSDEDIVPLDSDGNLVNDVVVSPSSAHIKIGIASTPAKKELLVSANILNSPQFPYRIADITVKPQRVIVAGRPQQLALVSTLLTEPIDVAGITSDITRQVRCMVPADTTLDSDAVITVTIHVVTQQPSVTVTPTPTQSSAPASVPTTAVKP